MTVHSNFVSCVLRMEKKSLPIGMIACVKKGFGKEYNCVVCLENGKKVSAQAQGEILQEVLLEIM